MGTVAARGHGPAAERVDGVARPNRQLPEGRDALSSRAVRDETRRRALQSSNHEENHQKGSDCESEEFLLHLFDVLQEGIRRLFSARENLIVFQKKEDNVMSMHEFTSGLHQLCRGS